MSTASRRVGYFLGILGATLVIAPAQAGELAVVGFDVPAVVVAERIDSALVDAPLRGGQLVRLRIPVSTYLSELFRGAVSEYSVEFESPHQSMRIVDFWPRNELYSDLVGAVSVENSKQNDSDFAFNVSGAVEPFVRGTANGNFHNKSAVNENYQRKPPMQILTSSGTIRRGFGVFFKFRPGPTPVLEGARDIAILAEVPTGWRADMLQVTMRAYGSTSTQISAHNLQSLGQSRLWMTTHLEGDVAAAAQASTYVRQERSLRTLAASSHEQVQDRSLPTVWHKVGVALDVINPRIPSDYLTQIIFGPANQYFDKSTNRLPVELRVAVLDYLDTRLNLLHLAVGSTATPDKSYVADNHVSVN